MFSQIYLIFIFLQINVSADAVSSTFASRVPSDQQVFVHARSETQTDALILGSGHEPHDAVVELLERARSSAPLSFLCEALCCSQNWVEPCDVCKKAYCANHLDHSTHAADFSIAAPQRVSAVSSSVASVIQRKHYTIELIIFS